MNEHLGAAILKGDTFAIEDFLKAGADPNAIIPGEEFAPIHLGAGTSQSVTQLLLKYGADPNARTHEGSTPLHIAASWGKSNVLKLLLRYGADVSIRDNEQLDALGVAGKYGYKNCVRILQDHGRKHEIDIQSKKLSSTYNQIEINVYLNDIKLFSTFVDDISKTFQNASDQFAEDGLITMETYKTDEDEYNCELKQSDDNILTLSINPCLISMSIGEEFSKIVPLEQTVKNKNHEEDDQRLDTNIKQESSAQENPNTKIEETFINHKQQESVHNDPKNKCDYCWNETIENPLMETGLHLSRCNQPTLIHDSDSNFHTSQHPKTYSTHFNDEHRYATEDEHQHLNIGVGSGSRQSLTLPNTGYHFDPESEIDPDETDRINCKVSDKKINKDSLDYKKSNDHSEYQKMAKTNDENRNLETKTVRSLTENSPRIPYSNPLVIKTNPHFTPERKTYRNKKICTEGDENIYPFHPCEMISADPYPENIQVKSKNDYNYDDEQTDSNDEIPIQFLHPSTETFEDAVKENRFENYSNNLYLNFAASVNRRKGLSTAKLSMKKTFHRARNCRVCLAIKDMFSRLKRKIIR